MQKYLDVYMDAEGNKHFIAEGENFSLMWLFIGKIKFEGY